MSLTKKVALNTGYQFIGKIISIAIGVIAIALMTRYLGPTKFGYYSTIAAFLQIAAVLFDLGLSLTAIRLIGDPKENANKILNNIFTLRLISSVVLLGLAVGVGFLMPYPWEIKVGIALTSFSYLFVSLNAILISLFQKQLSVGKVAVSEVFGRIALLAVVAYTVFANTGFYWILNAVVISSFVVLLANYIFSKKYIKLKLEIDWSVWKRILYTTWPIAIAIFFNLLYFKADTLVLSLTRTQAEVGIYSAPYRVLEILTALPFIYAGLILAPLTTAWVEKNLERFNSIVQKSFDFLSILIFPMIVGAVLLADQIIELIAGSEFAASAQVLQVIIFATAIIFISTLFGHLVVVINKQKKAIWGYLIVAAFALTSYIIFIPTYGYMAAAYLTVFAELIIAIFLFIMVAKTTKFIPNLNVFFKSIFAAILMAGPILLLQNSNLFIVILIAAAVYFAALYLLKGFSKEIIQELLKIKQ